MVAGREKRWRSGSSGLDIINCALLHKEGSFLMLSYWIDLPLGPDMPILRSNMYANMQIVVALSSASLHEAGNY